MGKTKTPEQKTAEALEKLTSEAKELGIKYSAEATAEELKDLIKAKKDEDKAAKAAKKDSFDVYNRDNNLVRTYSHEQHGEAAEDNAKEYAKKIGGSVK